jgi:CHASE3 domain sensor protein
MPPFRRQFGIVSGFVLLILLVLINAVVTRRQLAEQIEKRHMVAHSQAVLLQISETVSHLKDAETGQRGYLYTNNTAYLEPYQETVWNVQRSIEKLSVLTRYNPQQQEYVGKLHVLAKARLAELQQTIELNQAGKTDEAKAVVMTDLGKKTMDAIRDVADDMRKLELQLEEQRAR